MSGAVRILSLVTLLAVIAAVAVSAIHDRGRIVEIWHWLLTPISGAGEHTISTEVAWHGRLMVLAWTILMPTGLIVARFYKITPAQDWPRQLDNPFWFVNHRRLGYGIALVTTLAIALVSWSTDAVALSSGIHAVGGWLVFALGWFQIVGALLRGTHGGPLDSFTRQPRPLEHWPGDHFSMTTRRVVFEYSHKLVGYVLVPLVVWMIYSGLHIADAPNWMWIVISAWFLVCFGVCVHLQRSGKCIDTYQAIWGLDRTLPGYRRGPIGWGIRRVTEAEAGPDRRGNGSH